ncbi:hypothetical protein [Saccharothrix sp.]|uniref:hypothetical protein n=1 Tax=Saccharothrix sp. TaxID=1873460 RepID=UPI0028120E56|nr:hypothetical protein [Saccharothrix sp.]
MRRSLVPLLLCLGLLTGCTTRTALPAPTLGPAATDATTLVRSLADRSAEQYSVRFEAEQTMSSRRIHQQGDLVRSQDTRLLSLREDSVDVVVVPEAGYSRSSGGTWTRLGRVDRTPVKSGASVEALADEVDPRSVAQSLRGSLLVETRDEDLDGTPTHRYTLLVDLRVQAEQTADPARRNQLMAAYESGFTATATVWVGPGDLPVRVEQTLKTLEDKIFQQTVHTYTDWNANLKITAPTG